MTHDSVDVGRALGLPDEYQLVFAIAPFALGAGFITGWPGLFVLAGGILAYFVLNPWVYNAGWMPATVQAHEAADYAFGAFNRPLGIGLLLGSAIMGILMALPSIREALKSLRAAGGARAGGRDELGLKPVMLAAIGAVVLIFVATLVMGGKPVNAADPVTGEPVGQAYRLSENSTTGKMPVPPSEAGRRPAPPAMTTYAGYTIAFADNASRAAWEGWDDARRDAWLESINARPGWLAFLPGPARALVIALVGAAWIFLAGIIIAQCTGMTDWSPISGIALLTVVLVMLLAGSGAVMGAVLIGAALCVAITLASDMMSDLKTGQLVGAIPRKQQLLELATAAIGPVIAMGTILIIAQVNMKQVGVPLGPGTETTAPQAQALAAVIEGVQGGEMPYALYGAGALLGGLLGLGAFSGLGVLVGLSMYLPFAYISTYGIGCVVNMIVQKVKGRRFAEDWGVPLAAGLVVGESLLAMVINIIVLGRG